ncbi:hypothetical protein AB0C52_12880 [Streptomyces sp. NPDC048717]|uniref:hypothetical protein n=1 Tax=Streptomyces sp. NPDC048717 TaxID=3154928 RepID=UPI00341A4778
MAGSSGPVLPRRGSAHRAFTSAGGLGAAGTFTIGALGVVGDFAGAGVFGLTGFLGALPGFTGRSAAPPGTGP